MFIILEVVAAAGPDFVDGQVGRFLVKWDQCKANDAWSQTGERERRSRKIFRISASSTKLVASRVALIT